MKKYSLMLTIFFLLGAITNCQPKSQPQPKVDLNAIFFASPEETLKPTIWDTGDTTVTNEDRLDLFQPHVSDIKGGYFGVGSIQNFTLASWADSEYIWLMDFTRVVVATNKIHTAFLKHAQNPAEHRALWERKNEKRAFEIIEKEITNDDLKFVKQSYRKASPYLMISFKTIDKLTKKRNYTTWLQDQKYFDRLKNLAMNNRIRALRGDLNGDTTVKGIAEAATKMNVPMRILYYSNAEEYFGRQFGGYKDSFRKNFGAMPVDDKGFTVRTISFNKAKFVWADDSHLSTDRGFHYTLMSAKAFVNALNAPGKLNVTDFYKKAELEKTHRGLSFIKADTRTEPVKGNETKK